MDQCQIIQPSSLLAPYVKQYWFITIDKMRYGSQRIIPIGCVGLSFFRGERTYSASEKRLMPKSYISGLTKTYADTSWSGVLDFICIIFQPEGASAFFRMPINKLNNQQIEIEALSDFQLNDLEKKLEESTNIKTNINHIEEFLIRRIYLIGEYNQKRLSAVFKSIQSGQTDISALAQTACLGYKQFKRVFSEYIGINPKDFLRISRLQRVLYLMQIQPQITLAQLAYECNYSDKSHLIKEIKEFTGYTPGEFLSVCDPYSDYFSLFRSAFIDSPDTNLK